MADCFAAADVDDLHRRWLPREIFADIGIADAAPPSAADDVAVHLTGDLGGKEGPPRRPPPPPAPASRRRQHHYHQAAQVRGQQGAILVAYGGGWNGGGAPTAGPFVPYPSLQWQATTNFTNGGGFLGPMHTPPSRPFHGPPTTKRRLGGTGVFLPGAQVYQYQHKVAKGAVSVGWRALISKFVDINGKPPKEMLQRHGADQEATEMTQQQQSASAELPALPQEWTY